MCYTPVLSAYDTELVPTFAFNFIAWFIWGDLSEKFTFRASTPLNKIHRISIITATNMRFEMTFFAKLKFTGITFQLRIRLFNNSLTFGRLAEKLC
jgi:hypothetical protein